MDSYVDLPPPATAADAACAAVVRHLMDRAADECPALLSFRPLTRWSQDDDGETPVLRVAAEAGDTIADEAGDAVAGSIDVAVSLECPVGDEEAAADFDAARGYLAGALGSPAFRAALAAAFPGFGLWSPSGPESAEPDGARLVAAFYGELYLASFDFIG